MGELRTYSYTKVRTKEFNPFTTAGAYLPHKSILKKKFVKGLRCLYTIEIRYEYIFGGGRVVLFNNFDDRKSEIDDSRESYRKYQKIALHLQEKKKMFFFQQSSIQF